MLACMHIHAASKDYNIVWPGKSTKSISGPNIAPLIFLCVDKLQKLLTAQFVNSCNSNKTCVNKLADDDLQNLIAT